MKNTIQLPYLDQTGEMTPHVIEAMTKGVTSEIDPDSADHIILTFKTAKDRDAFAKLVGVLAEPEAEAEKPAEE